MRTTGLIIASLILPLIWGWLSHRLMAWMWPAKQPPAVPPSTGRYPRDPLADYQI